MIVGISIFLISNSVTAKNFSQDSLTVKSNRVNTKDSGKVLENKTKSPRTAMICSLAFPGLGQFYNGKKFKAVIFLGAEVGLLWNSIYLNQMYKKSTDDYVREFYIENRNLSNWWLVGVVLISILDSYVDAHLSDFDESPDLSIDFDVDDVSKTILVSCSWPF